MKKNKSKKQIKIYSWLILSLIVLVILLVNFLIENIFNLSFLVGWIEFFLWILFFIGGYGYFIQLGSPLKKSFKFIREIRKYIYCIAGIFLVFFVLGFLINVPDFLVEKIMKFIEDILEQTKDLNFIGLIKFIFINNLKSSFFGMVFGIFFGIFSIVVSVTNGFLLGFVGEISVQMRGILSFWRIFPHGVFELPAVFISLGLGLNLGLFFFIKNSKQGAFLGCLIDSLRVFFFVIIPLLLIAAIIESSFIFLAS